MEKIKKIIKDHKLLLDIINVILGISLVILIVLVFLKPTNHVLLKSAFYIGGLMNILNGYKLYKNRAIIAIAMSLIVTGLLIIFAGVFLV